jgi:hypothetical protein
VKGKRFKGFRKKLEELVEEAKVIATNPPNPFRADGSGHSAEQRIADSDQMCRELASLEDEVVNAAVAVSEYLVTAISKIQGARDAFIAFRERNC